MSEKVIDPDSLLTLVRPGAARADRRLFEERREREFNLQRIEDQALDPGLYRQAVPNARLVFSEATGLVGVAVKGAARVCPLPRGYGGPGCELALLPGDRIVVIQPDQRPLEIDPRTGTTKPL